MLGHATYRTKKLRSRLFPTKRREFHPPHIYADDACYFITPGTARRQRFLNTDAKRELLRDVLKEALEPYGVRLYAWVILADHYHLLLQTSGVAPINRFIQRLLGQSAIRLNKQDGTAGRQVWYQYWDRFPRGEPGFWACFNYIHVNPIKHGYVRLSDGALKHTREQVTIVPDYAADVHMCLSEYPHSSYHYYLREHGEEFLTDLWARYPFPDNLDHGDF